MMATITELPKGFANKVLSAQSTFRVVMDAMATPGRVQTIAAVAGAPPPMMLGTAALALTLFDHDTPIWLDPGMSKIPAIAKWLKFHTGAPIVLKSAVCSFALIADAKVFQCWSASHSAATKSGPFNNSGCASGKLGARPRL